MNLRNLLLAGLLPVQLSLAMSAEWHPAPSTMLTEWGKKVDPRTVWREYPRPLLERSNWTNLNGLWKYAVTPKDAASPGTWAGEILVPFAPEAALSGVGRITETNEALWYSRSLPAPKPGLRTILHFEAVDYETTIWVNGKEIGGHTGGFTPFEFDITDALKASNNELVVRVYDTTGGYQIKGKQVLRPEGCWYTRVSGIWQTVWLEEVPQRYVENLDYEGNIKTGTLTVKPKLSGPPNPGEKVRIFAYFQGRLAASAIGQMDVPVVIPNPQLWSPDKPNIYDLVIQLLDGRGVVVDTVKSYAALREVGKVRDAKGNLRFSLNGKPIFHWGPLDQGWWPDGLLTPPSDEAMLSDIRFLKAAGFNMIRKHIKVEPRRYYAYCDRLGMMVWQDQVSGGPNPSWTQLKPDPKDADWPPEASAQWELEYKRMVDSLRNNPSIVVWTVFNEAWGQHRTLEMGEMAANYDKTRPINIASGGNFWDVGDIVDAHSYPDPWFPFGDRYRNYIKVVGEFGGHGWPVQGHLWKPDAKNWGYGDLPKTLDEWKQRYQRSIDILCKLREQGVAAGVYTQTTDVEGEVNGLLTYDRLPKADPAWLKSLADKLLSTPDVPPANP